ncbi:MAG: hypothetical protein IJ759_04285 [Bacteroidales bacterium]|nr:hypothetical protein [Bacteroidales bacterium]
MFRRTIKLLTLVAMVFVGRSNSFAQNQWDEEDILTIDDEYLISAQYCQGISYSTDNGILKIYNSDFDCIKTVSFFPDIPNIRNKHLRVYCLTKGIFTSNNKYEFLVAGGYSIRTEDENGSVSYSDYTIDGLYNEDGDLLYEFNLSVESNTEVDVRR